MGSRQGWTLPRPPDPMEVLAREFTTAAREVIEYDKATESLTGFITP